MLQTKPIEVATLASVDEFPDREVVIFDGKCIFCRAQVTRLYRWAPNRFAFISIHDPRVAELYPDLDFELLMRQMFVVDREGNRHGGADSIKYLSRKLPRLWLLAPLMHIPFSMPFWRWCYKQVAKRRYLLAGKTDSCDDGSCEVPYD